MRVKRAKPLSETEAVALGADMIAETMVWSAATLQVLAVYWWQYAEKEEKKEILDRKFTDIQQNIDKSQRQLEIMQRQITFIKSYLSVHSTEDGPSKDDVEDALLRVP